MRVGSTLKPGAPGTRKLTQRDGDRLVAVRYRYDKPSQRRYTTVELIEDSQPWYDTTTVPDVVAVRVDWKEDALRARLSEQADAHWDQRRKLWIMSPATARTLGLVDRAVPTVLARL